MKNGFEAQGSVQPPVNDLKPYIKRLKEHNISLWNSKRLNFGEGGVLIFSDPDGGMIEIQGPSVK